MIDPVGLPSQPGATVTPGGPPGTTPLGPDIAPLKPQTIPPGGSPPPAPGGDTTPDLTKSGVDVLKGYIAETDPQFQQELRQTTQRAAATGRLNSGLTTSELGDVALQRGKNINALSQELAGSLAPADLQAQMQSIALRDALLNSQFGRQATAAQYGLGGAGELGGEAGQASSGAGSLLSNVALQNYLKSLYRQPGQTASI